MRFEKTNADIRLLGRVPREELKIDNVLQLVLDVMLDAVNEAGMSFEKESITENGAAAWIAVVKALNSLQTDQVMGGAVSARRKEKLREARSELLTAESNILHLEKEIDEKQQLETEKKKQLEVLQDKHEKAQRLMNEIRQLEKQLEEKRDKLQEKYAVMKGEEEKVLAETETLTTGLETLRAFFASDECKEKQKQIERLKETIRLYQEVVAQLFRKEVSVSFLFENYHDEMAARRASLERQLKEIETSMRGLKDNYTETITNIERRVNEW